MREEAGAHCVCVSSCWAWRCSSALYATLGLTYWLSCSSSSHTRASCSRAPSLCHRNSQQGKIKSLEQVYLFSMPVKEYQIVESFLGPSLKDEVMKIMPVQKQTRAGQRTRFKVRAACDALRVRAFSSLLLQRRRQQCHGGGRQAAAARARWR